MTALLRAMIFDFNGVIADDEMPHFLAFQQALVEEGFPLSKEEYYSTYLGMDERHCAAALLTQATGHCHPLQLRRILARKASLFWDTIHTPKPQLFPGVVQFVQRAAERYPLAIASGGLRNQIDFALEGTPLERTFSVIVSAEDTSAGKPDPAIYHRALEKLNVTVLEDWSIQPQECLVFEDSKAGILAARRAGMKFAALPTTYASQHLTEADCILEGFAMTSNISNAYFRVTSEGIQEMTRVVEHLAKVAAASTRRRVSPVVIGAVPFHKERDSFLDRRGRLKSHIFDQILHIRVGCRNVPGL